MYFSTVVALAAIPFLAGAVPVSLKSSRTGRPVFVPLSKPSSHLKDDGFVDLGKLEASHHYSMSRLDQAFIAYERNTGQPHPLVLKRGHSNERRIFVPVPLTSDVDVFWTADIVVGTPGRSFSVAVDTTTPDMFLTGPSCTTCNGKNPYNISLSSTGKNLSSTSTADRNFALGGVFGNLASDDVFVAGNKVPNQMILVATELAPFFLFPGFSKDGVLGLGFNQTSAFGAVSYFETLVALGGPSNGDPVFGYFLADSGPELIIGGTDRSKISGDLSFINLVTQGFWQIPMDSISINGNEVVTAKEAILDTGSTFISGDSQTIDNIYANIPGSAPISNLGQFTIPCDTTVTITITFGGTAYNIPPSAYNIGKTLAGGTLSCIGGFAKITTGLPSMVIGTVFLKNVYTEFDQGNLRVGFGQIA